MSVLCSESEFLFRVVLYKNDLLLFLSSLHFHFIFAKMKILIKFSLTFQ